MIHLEILLEEQSMQEVLKIILPQLGVKSYRLHPHQGKTNLLKQLPKLLRAYSNWIPENYRIIVILDQDDCYELKKHIVDICQSTNLLDRVKIRIIVRMLEAWFFGESTALEQVFPKLKRLNIGTKEIYRNPEERPDPARDLDRELKEVGYKTGYIKTLHSGQIAAYLSLNNNKTNSYNITIQAIQELIHESGESD